LLNIPDRPTTKPFLLIAKYFPKPDFNAILFSDIRIAVKICCCSGPSPNGRVVPILNRPLSNE